MNKPVIREVIKPKDEAAWLELRTKDITSTEISALFGISPYMTEFELWHRKKEGAVVKLDPNERMKWGTRLQNTIAEGIAEDNGWSIRRMEEYIRLPRLKLGSSFDFIIDETKDCVCRHGILDHDPTPADPLVFECKERGCNCKKYYNKEINDLLEIKNVDSLAFRDGWLVDGDNIEAPPHIEMQIQHQMLVSGCKVAYIGALVGGNKVKLIKRAENAIIHSVIKEKAAKFWKSIEDNVEPNPDFSRDAEIIARLYNYAEPGKVLDASKNAYIELLVLAYKNEVDIVKETQQRRDAIKAELLTLIGDHEKVLGERYTISTGLIGPTWVEAYERKGYRNFRVNYKKENKNGK